MAGPCFGETPQVNRAQAPRAGRKMKRSRAVVEGATRDRFGFAGSQTHPTCARVTQGHCGSLQPVSQKPLIRLKESANFYVLEFTYLHWPALASSRHRGCRLERQ